jgi:hypothetical protein
MQIERTVDVDDNHVLEFHFLLRNEGYADLLSLALMHNEHENHSKTRDHSGDVTKLFASEFTTQMQSAGLVGWEKGGEWCERECKLYLLQDATLGIDRELVLRPLGLWLRLNLRMPHDCEQVVRYTFGHVNNNSIRMESERGIAIAPQT